MSVPIEIAGVFAQSKAVGNVGDTVRTIRQLNERHSRVLFAHRQTGAHKLVGAAAG